MKRTYRYLPDGTSYEVTKAQRPPAIHFLHTGEAIGADGQAIPAAKLRELNRQGKALHIEECRNIAMDAHNESLRREQRDKQERKNAIASVIKGYGA